MKFDPIVPNGFSKQYLKKTRRRFNLKGLTQIHHVVPRSISNHEVIQMYNYDTESPYNLIFLPTTEGQRQLTLRENRVIHDGGHMKYNDFVVHSLNNCQNYNDFLFLLIILHKGSRGYLKIPWK